MSEIPYSDAEHEARHVVAGWFFGGDVWCARVGIHAAERGIVKWTPEKLGIGDLIVALVGWIGDPDLPKRSVWPEPWPIRANAPEGIGTLVRELGLTEAQYEDACGLAEELTEHEQFKEAVALVARALMIAPSIEHEGLERLREQTGFADQEPEGALTCST